MAAAQKILDLEINQDMKYQELSWRLQRIGWILMVLLLVAALLGLLGNGPLSKAKANDSASILSVEYNRFERYRSPVTLTVRIGPQAVSGNSIQLWVDREYLKENELKAIQPESEASTLIDDKIIFEFPVANLKEQALITFHLEPDKSGTSNVRIGVVGGSELAFKQFIYP